MLMSMANTWRRLKREIFNSAYRSSIVETAFRWQVAGEEWGENEKDWVEKVQYNDNNDDDDNPSLPNAA